MEGASATIANELLTFPIMQCQTFNECEEISQPVGLTHSRIRACNCLIGPASLRPGRLWRHYQLFVELLRRALLPCRRPSELETRLTWVELELAWPNLVCLCARTHSRFPEHIFLSSSFDIRLGASVCMCQDYDICLISRTDTLSHWIL